MSLSYSAKFQPCDSNGSASNTSNSDVGNGGTGTVNLKDIKPPGWNENWEWRYGTRGVTPRWFEPNGAEWRLHTPDAHHNITHWDYNPWTGWNTKWQNIPFGGGQ